MLIACQIGATELTVAVIVEEDENEGGRARPLNITGVGLPVSSSPRKVSK